MQEYKLFSHVLLGLHLQYRNYSVLAVYYTFYFIVFDMKVRAIPENADNPLWYFLTNYLHSASKL